MLKSERKQLILTQLNQNGFVTLETLSGILEISESTIRRDLDELAAEKRLRRVHGGAEKINGLKEEPSNSQKAITNVQEKAALASYAAGLIKDGDVIFLEAGTTNELMIPDLVDRNITVVTNSVHHAVKLVDNNIATSIIGGMIKHATDASIGSIAVDQIKQLNFDKAFIGANGVDAINFTTPDMEEAAVKRAVLGNSKKSFILVDSSKIGQVSYIKVAKVEKVTIVTNHSERELLIKLKEKTKVVEV
ncbi:DeoR/GlpR family DNA-binding transcription regulator [Streptococcus dentiloxodontae]